LSKIALSGNPSGNGTFTIAAPNSNNSRTMTLPDSAGDVVVTQATQTLTNKTFSGAQVFGTASLAEPTGTAPLYMCRAWVNFNGTLTTGNIRASGNVSSVTRTATGNYTVNLATAMPDVNYAVCLGTTYNNSATGRFTYQDDRLGTKSTTQIFIACDDGGTYRDSNQVAVSIFR
jgi:hypothetical protein